MPGSAPRATLNNPYGPLVTFRTEDVLPPSGLYISMNDIVVALFACFAGAGTYSMTTRMLLPDGTIQSEVYVSQNSPNPSVPWIIMPPVEGYLLSLVVEATGTIDGSQWCQVATFRGSVATPLITLPPNAGLLIVQGYVDQQSWLSWPNSPIVEGGTGAGRIRAISVAPTTGVNWSVSTTAYQRWEIISVQMVMTTSAAVATRLVTLGLLDRFGVGVCSYPCAQTQAASSTVEYFFFNGASYMAESPGLVTAGVPAGLTLDPGMQLVSNVNALQPTDTISSIVVNVKEWMGVSHA